MTEEEKRLSRRFYKAEQEAGFVEKHETHTAQTQSASYKLAFRDTEFLLREELRPVRFQLELLKTEMLMEEAGIGSTLVCYGSARIPAPEKVEEKLAAATTPEEKAIAERLAANARYYDEARKLARIASQCAIVEQGKRQFVICSGGGLDHGSGQSRRIRSGGREYRAEHRVAA
jgi:hypothetical protein